MISINSVKDRLHSFYPELRGLRGSNMRDCAIPRCTRPCAWYQIWGWGNFNQAKHDLRQKNAFFSIRNLVKIQKLVLVRFRETCSMSPYFVWKKWTTQAEMPPLLRQKTSFSQSPVFKDFYLHQFFCPPTLALYYIWWTSNSAHKQTITQRCA